MLHHLHRTKIERSSSTKMTEQATADKDYIEQFELSLLSNLMKAYVKITSKMTCF